MPGSKSGEGASPGPGRLFSHKPRRPSSASSSPFAGGAASTAGESGFTSGLSLVRPFLDRLRGGFGVLLAANLVLGGYILFHGRAMRSAKREKPTPTSSSSPGSGAGSGDEGLSSAPGSQPPSTAGAAPAPAQQQQQQQQQQQALRFAGATVDEGIEPAWVLESMLDPPIKAPRVPYQDQIAVLQWILEEKRSVKPANREEKRRTDADKKLLKDLIRSRASLPLKDL